MRRHIVTLFLTGIVLLGCTSPIVPTSSAPGRDVPFPATWTPTIAVENTPTATLVVRPTPTWDGTLPPPSEAEVPRLQPGRLYRDLGSDLYAVVDLRNFAAYKQAHIVGAQHIPLEELPDRIGELDGNKTIVFYDLSPNDFMSLAAAMYLYGLGFTKIAVLDGGLQKWYAEGYPIEGTLLTPTPGAIAPPMTVTLLSTVGADETRSR